MQYAPLIYPGLRSSIETCLIDDHSRDRRQQRERQPTPRDPKGGLIQHGPSPVMGIVFGVLLLERLLRQRSSWLRIYTKLP